MERVWDYPRPPAVVPCERTARVQLGGRLVADSPRALRVLETSHPPVIYIPAEDVAGVLTPSPKRSTWCEFKRRAEYLDFKGRTVAWTYPEPAPGYEALKGHIAFYPGRAAAAWLAGGRAGGQAGDFSRGGAP